jgi:hypothetical protein
MWVQGYHRWLRASVLWWSRNYRRDLTMARDTYSAPHRQGILDRAVQLVRKGESDFSLETLHKAIEEKGLSVGVIGILGENPQAELLLHFVHELNQESIQTLQQMEK